MAITAADEVKMQASASQTTPPTVHAQPPPVEVPLKIDGLLFEPLADALPMSFDLVGLVVQYNLNDLIIKVGGDLARLSRLERTALNTASKEVKFLDLGDMVLTARNGLQLEKTFPHLETIVESGKECAWEEWKNTALPGETGLPISPVNLWQLALTVSGIFQICRDFEREVKSALSESPFFSWYNSTSDRDPILVHYRNMGIHPLQHRLACLFFTKLAAGFKIKKRDCVFQGKTIAVRVGKQVLQTLHPLSGLKNSSPQELAQIEHELLQPEIPEANTKVKKLSKEILMTTCSLPILEQLPLSQEESSAIRKLLSLT